MGYLQFLYPLLTYLLLTYSWRTHPFNPLSRGEFSYIPLNFKGDRGGSPLIPKLRFGNVYFQSKLQFLVILSLLNRSLVRRGSFPLSPPSGEDLGGVLFSLIPKLRFGNVYFQSKLQFLVILSLLNRSLVRREIFQL